MKIRVVFRVVVCVLLLALVGSAAKVEAGQRHSRRPTKIGVLVSLTGSWSSLGKNTAAALHIAADRFKQRRTVEPDSDYLFAIRSSIRRRPLRLFETWTSAVRRSSSDRNRAPRLQ